MVKRDGDDVVQLLIDTGVLTPEDGARIQSVQVDVIIQHMKDRAVVTVAEEPQLRDVLAVLMQNGAPAKHLQAKIQLVNIITNNIHRKLEHQGRRVQKQKAHISGDAYPMVARLASKTTK